ncbi:MAG: murein biosynthesis integral membrane protein MurJ [Longimicrobiales bacterium]
MSPNLSPAAAASSASTRSARLVASGILLSRIAGLVREVVFARYFGTSASADAFRTALRMPNVLQNLLGEGVLSASFIPVYSELLRDGREEEAGRVAGAIFALLFALAGALALIGMMLAPVLVTVFAPGFEGLQYELTVTLTRIIFPMTGILVLSAWSLGVLNSHRHFFLPYVAPVLWNAAMIAAMLALGGRLQQPGLAIALAWGALVGGALQFMVQLPAVVRLERSLKIRWDLRREGVRVAVRNAGPAVVGRGVVQLSGYVDIVLGSLLSIGAIASLGYAQTLYMLPVSLFGMAVAAAELPELARERASAADVLRQRVNAGLARIAFYVVPSAIAFFTIGDVLIAALYQRGSFSPADVMVVYWVLFGYTVGLMASTGTRLFSSAYFALHDTRTPALFAMLRVLTSALLGAALMVQLGRADLGPVSFGPYGFGWFTPPVLGTQMLGPAGLSLGAGLAAWLEWYLLRRRLKPRIGAVNPPLGPLLRMLLAASVAGLCALLSLAVLPTLPKKLLEGVLAAGVFGIVYFVLGAILQLDEARSVLGRLLRRR